MFLEEKSSFTPPKKYVWGTRYSLLFLFKKASIVVDLCVAARFAADGEPNWESIETYKRRFENARIFVIVSFSVPTFLYFF